MLLCHDTDANWPRQLLSHKTTCVESAETLDSKRHQRQQRWQQRMRRAIARRGSTGATAAASSLVRGGGSSGGSNNASAASADPLTDSSTWVDKLTPAPLVGPDDGITDTYDCVSDVSDDEFEANLALESAAHCGCEVRQQASAPMQLRSAHMYCLLLLFLLLLLLLSALNDSPILHKCIVLPFLPVVFPKQYTPFGLHCPARLFHCSHWHRACCSGDFVCE
jgi:hypothetical protein